MSEPIILGIDHGYANMKTVHTCFPSGLTVYGHEPYSMERVLEYEGKYYVAGSGRQPLQQYFSHYNGIRPAGPDTAAQSPAGYTGQIRRRTP